MRQSRRRGQHRARWARRRRQRPRHRSCHRRRGYRGRNRGADTAGRVPYVGTVIALFRRTVRSPAGPRAAGTPLRRGRRWTVAVQACESLLDAVGHRLDRITHDPRRIETIRVRSARHCSARRRCRRCRTVRRARRRVTARACPRIRTIRARRLRPRNGWTSSRDRGAHTQRHRERSDPTDEPGSGHHVLLFGRASARHVQQTLNLCYVIAQEPGLAPNIDEDDKKGVGRPIRAIWLLSQDFGC
jgi:hypothetical protein